MGEIITKQSERVTRFLGMLDRMMDGLDRLATNYTPRLGGETYLTENELSKRLKVSTRTLQEWRSGGKIEFIQFEKKGKVVYAESAVQLLLEKSLNEAWK